MVALSVLGAAIIWTLSALNKEYTTIIRCALIFQYDKEGTIEVKPPPSYLEANVTGSGWDLLKQNLTYRRDPITINIDNPLEIKKITGYSIQPMVAEHLQGSISLNFIATDTLNLAIQRILEKKLFVYLDSTTIEVPPSFQIVGPVDWTPDSVLVTGPESFIHAMPDTLMLMLEAGVSSDYNDNMVLTHVRPDLMKYYPPQVNVHFDVAPYVNQNRAITIDLVNFPTDSSAFINPPQIPLEFEINEDSIRLLRDMDFIVIADFNNMNKKDSTIYVELITTPSYVRDIHLDSTQVKVIFKN